MAGFLIPSLEQYRYLRHYKRQRRLELEQRARAVIEIPTPSPPRRKHRHRHELSMGSESAAASHVSNLLGESQLDDVDENDFGQRETENDSNPVADDAKRARTKSAADSHHPARQNADYLNALQSEPENTQSSSATEMPPFHERIQLPRHSILLQHNHHSTKPNSTAAPPSNSASAAAAAATDFLAAANRQQEPPTQEMLDPLVYPGEIHNGISSSGPCNHGRNSHGDNGDDDAINFAAAVVDPLPSSFVITSPVRQAESSQGTVSPIQSPVEAMERYQREQQQRGPSKQEISRMQQQSLAFPQKKRSSRLSNCSTSAKPWFQTRKRRPKMAQTTLSFHGGGSGK
jgi:hypothetical protein